MKNNKLLDYIYNIFVSNCNQMPDGMQVKGGPVPVLRIDLTHPAARAHSSMIYSGYTVHKIFDRNEAKRKTSSTKRGCGMAVPRFTDTADSLEIVGWKWDGEGWLWDSRPTNSGIRRLFVALPEWQAGILQEIVGQPSHRCSQFLPHGAPC